MLNTSNQKKHVSNYNQLKQNKIVPAVISQKFIKLSFGTGYLTGLEENNFVSIVITPLSHNDENMHLLNIKWQMLNYYLQLKAINCPLLHCVRGDYVRIHLQHLQH